MTTTSTVSIARTSRPRSTGRRPTSSSRRRPRRRGHRGPRHLTTDDLTTNPGTGGDFAPRRPSTGGEFIDENDVEGHVSR